MTFGFKKDGVGQKGGADKKDGFEKITAMYTGRGDKALAQSEIVLPKVAKPSPAAATKTGARRPPPRR